MTIKEIIEDLELSNEYEVNGYSVRHYGSFIHGISQETLDAIIPILKAQEPKPPIIKENSYGWKFYYCPSCGKEFYQNNKFAFCEKCGQAVKWECVK